MDDPFFRRAEDKFYERSVSPKVVKVLKQTGRRPNIVVDKSRTALKPGKRISKTGHIYWETRKNRTDITPTKKI